MSSSQEPSQVFEENHFEFGEGLVARKFRLTNGLKIIVLEDHSSPLFAYQTWYGVGSRNEREGITGIAHLFEHLMFKETRTRKEGDFDRMMEEQGGEINAATFVDWTFYRETLPSAAFSMVPPLEADRMQNVVLSDEQVSSEREVVANERRFRVENSPDGTMQESLYSTAFRQHPYRWPVIGWMKDIQAMSREDCLKFYQTYYAPNNATIVLVGDVETSKVLREINEAYGAIPSSEIPSEEIPVEPEQEAERRVFLELSIPSEKLLMGYRSIGATHPHLFALEVANTVLTGGRSSRLYRKLISDGQICSDLAGYSYPTKDPGLQIFEATMRAGEKATKAEEIIAEELKRIGEELVGEEELAKAKNQIEMKFWENFSTVDEKAEALGYHEVTIGDYRRVFTDMEKLRGVTAADVQNTVKQYCTPKNRTVVTARPQKEESK